MKGLLLKDWYCIKNYFRAFLIFDIIFLIVSCFSEGMSFYLFYPCVFSSLISMSLLSYEEQEKWNVYVQTLPYSKAQLVSTKYIISLLIGLSTVFVCTFVQLLMSIYRQTFDISTMINLITTLVSCSTIPAAVLLPFIYKFGVTKGRIAYYIIIALLCAILGVVGKIDQWSSALIPVSNIDTILFVLSVIVFPLSWLLSVKFYQKRDI